MQDEAEYWVPGEAARLGLEFLTSKIPHASPRVIMDFLRSMNKVTARCAVCAPLVRCLYDSPGTSLP